MNLPLRLNATKKDIKIIGIRHSFNEINLVKTTTIKMLDNKSTKNTAGHIASTRFPYKSPAFACMSIRYNMTKKNSKTILVIGAINFF